MLLSFLQIFLFEAYGQEGDGGNVFYDEDFFRMLAEVHGEQPQNGGDAAEPAADEASDANAEADIQQQRLEQEAAVNTSDEEDAVPDDEPDQALLQRSTDNSSD